MAIPVEHVRCVLEVKAIFSPSTSGDAIDHLRDLLPLMGGPDKPSEKYKLHLPETFCCGTVFFDLRQEHQYSEAALNKIFAGRELRGFLGGLILRGEGHDKNLTGRLIFLSSETTIESTFGKNKSSLLKIGITESVIDNNRQLSLMLSWAEPYFSMFSFDVIALMQGTYESGVVSSLHGMGMSEWPQSKS